MSLPAPGRADAAPHLPRFTALTPGRGGQPRLLVDAPAGRAEIYLHGAQLTSWVPRAGSEVLFTSRQAVYDGVASVRGGVPLCLPWFGLGPRGTDSPKHGWGRHVDWVLREVEPHGDGVVARLETEHDGVAARYEVCVGEALSLSLSLRGTGAEPVVTEMAIHIYLRVGDVTGVEITGLEGARYEDALDGFAWRTQGDGPLTVNGPVDRVYQCQGPVAVSDPALGRRVVSRPQGAANVVVWNPWADLARDLADMADDEFASMVCVETASVRSHARTLAPGESWSVGVRYTVEQL